MKIDGTWGGGRDTTYKDAPQHKACKGTGGAPEGGNQVFADGSARWCKYSTMYYFHSWTANMDRICLFYQDPQDFSQGLKNVLNSIRADLYR
jgi:hypothetical protein